LRSGEACHMRCESRWIHSAWTPGYPSATSTRLRAAGSPRRAASRSSRRRSRNRTSESCTSVGELAVEGGGEVPLAEARDDDDDRLARGLGPGGDLEGRVDGGAGGDAGEDALLRGEAAGDDGRLLEVDVDDLVVDLG